jgi:hypothetical protein
LRKVRRAEVAYFFRFVDDADGWVGRVSRRVQESFKRAPVGMLGLVVAILSQEDQIFLESILHGKGPGSRLARRLKKHTGEKINAIAIFRLIQIPASHLAAPCESAFAQTVNRTKMFHVKHFGTIARKPAHTRSRLRRAANALPDESTAVLWAGFSEKPFGIESHASGFTRAKRHAIPIPPSSLVPGAGAPCRRARSGPPSQEFSA